MKLSEIMTPQVERIEPEKSVSEAAKKMDQLNIGIIPVYEHDRLIGMVSDRDIVVRCIAQDLDPRTTSVQDVMTKDVVYAFEDQELKEVAKIMEEHKVRRVVVLNRDKRLTGIASLGDFSVFGDNKKLASEVLNKAAAIAPRPQPGNAEERSQQTLH